MKKSILFVDDEELNLKSLVKTFKGTYNVFSAADIESAKKIVTGNKIDLVLCDLIFPGANSIDFLKQMDDDYPAVKYIIVSGYLDDFENEMKQLKNLVFKIQKPKLPKFYKTVIKEILKG